LDLKTTFTASFDLNINQSVANTIKLIRTKYELKDQHVQALNTAYLGIHRLHFYESDEHDVLDTFGVFMGQIEAALDNVTSLVKEHKVASDPFALFLYWAVHKTNTGNLQVKTKTELMLDLLRLLHYRYFSSLVGHRFQFKPREDVMRATIESLSMKPDISKYGTWKNVIYARCEDILSSSSIHRNTLKTFAPDEKVYVMVSDVQTRIRGRINTISVAFYDTLEEANTIKSYGNVELINGEKVLKETGSTLDAISTRLSADLLSNAFIDGTSIKLLCGINKELKPTMFRNLIIRYTDLAQFQARKGTLDLEGKNKEGVVYIGHRLLIQKIVEVTYRYVATNGTNMKNKFEILKATQNMYRASQITVPEVDIIKRSVGIFIDSFPGTNRTNTKSILRSAFISYVMLLSFKYL
jgi:hypothetical protein